MDGVLEFFRDCWGCLLFALGVGAAIVILAAVLSYGSCSAKIEGNDFEWRWGFLSGCQIQFDGVWIDRKAYQARVVEQKE